MWPSIANMLTLATQAAVEAEKNYPLATTKDQWYGIAVPFFVLAGLQALIFFWKFARYFDSRRHRSASVYNQVRMAIKDSQDTTPAPSVWTQIGCLLWIILSIPGTIILVMIYYGIYIRCVG